MSDSQKIDLPDPLDDPRLTALALGELASGDVSLDDEARREVDEIARFADSLGAALRTDEAGLDAGRRAAILAASLGMARKAPVLPLPAVRGRALRRVVKWSAGGAVAAGLAFTVVPNLVEARKHGNEAAAIGALRTTNSAETLFREGDKEQNGTLHYGDVAQLSATTLIDGVLGHGKRQGHTLDLRPSTPTSEYLWFANANPNAPTSTGDRYFSSNHSGVIYYTQRESVAIDTAGTMIPTHLLPVGKGEGTESTGRLTLYGSSMFGGRTENALSREEVDRLRDRSVADHAKDMEGFVDPFVPLDPAVERAHVERLLQRSLEQLSVRRFGAAEQALAEALARDPTNEEALKLRQVSREARALVAARDLGALASGPNAGDLEVPYFPHGRVEFPDKERWMKIRARDVGIAAPVTQGPGGANRATPAPEWVRDYAQVLRSRRVTFDFASTPLGEVVSTLQDVTGLNITIPPGVDQERTTITLQVQGAPVAEVLRLVCEQTKLRAGLEKETLLLAPRDAEEYGIDFESGSTTNGLTLNGFFPAAPAPGPGPMPVVAPPTLHRVEIDGMWYELPTSTPTPTTATTVEGLYTDGWRPTPLIETTREPQSTFAVDVDTASYARVRASIRVQNTWPAASTVRVEELVNYHEYGYPAPTDGRPIAASTEVTTCPWAPDRRLVRIGLRGRGLEGQARPAANLVFLIDVSGSMASVEKLPLVQRALTLLVSQLGAQDKVSIVVYAGASGCVLDGASGADKAAILGALERLQSGGSTNGGAGIELAYQLASRRFVEGGVNRVILCTDGDWNLGAQSQQALEALIAQKAQGHVSLTALGFGMSAGGDKTLETLADRGDGNYAYVDGLPEARRVLVEQLEGTLVTIGKDVKVQVEWDPARVTGYTLVGYEDRRLENKDFANDAKDAGDVGARHAVTALYEVTTKPGARDLGVLRLRWKAVKAGVAEGTSELLEVPLVDDGRTLEKTSTDTRFAMGVAAFALGLKAGPGPGRQLLDVAQALADGARGEDPHGLRAELSELVRAARGLGR